MTQGLGRDERDLARAAALNNNTQRAHEGDLKARKRMIKGLTNCRYGYEIDLIRAAALNTRWAENGDLEATNRMIESLVTGKFGYERDPERALALALALALIVMRDLTIFH